MPVNFCLANLFTYICMYVGVMRTDTDRVDNAT